MTLKKLWLGLAPVFLVGAIAGLILMTPVDVQANTVGCTPGYWKNHTDHWPTPYTPETTLGGLGGIFTGVSSANSGKTLLQALSFHGGPGVAGAELILLRAAVAAILNGAQFPDLDDGIGDGIPFPTPGWIIGTATGPFDNVNAALASGDRARMLALATTLDGWNNTGCPLN